MPPSDPASAVPAFALGLRDCAKSLSISERSAWQLVHDGRLACVRVGVRIIIPTTAIQDFLQREAKAQAAPVAEAKP